MPGNTLVLIDGPNVCNDIARFLTKQLPNTEPELRRSYFRNWLDIDRLVGATLGPDLRVDPIRDLGTVILHSRKGIGAKDSDYSIHGDDVISFWGRQGANPCTATMLVDIPGARAGAEKGIDTSIVVYLFETLERWDAAVLFSNDADFVPAVWSLRRRGKRVYCASHLDDATTPLVQACQTFLPWSVPFMLADVWLFEALRPGGTFDAMIDGLGRARPKKLHANAQGLMIECSDAVRDDERHDIERRLTNSCMKVACINSHVVNLFVPPETSTPSQLHPANEWVFAGIRRHAYDFAGAKWHGLL
jgi:hypothetical protein